MTELNIFSQIEFFAIVWKTSLYTRGLKLKLIGGPHFKENGPIGLILSFENKPKFGQSFKYCQFLRYLRAAQMNRAVCLRSPALHNE